MTLDIEKIYGQVEDMAGDLRSQAAQYDLKIAAALQSFQDVRLKQAELQEKIERARTTFLVAGIRESIDQKYPAPAAPTDFAVIGSDGSQIDVDRHSSARFFLLNTGVVRIQYGSRPSASLESIPALCFGDEQLSLRSEDGRQAALEGDLLGIKRDLEEWRHLADSVASTDPALPVLAIVDGTLIKWGLQGQNYDDFVIRQLLDDGFIKQLDRIALLSRNRQAALCSYISLPRATDVVNMLRLFICPYEPVDCDNKECKKKLDGRPCDVIAGMTDRHIFGKILSVGERSAVFYSRSSIINKYDAHRVCFFYLKLDEEVARVEIPLWVAENPKLLDLTHGMIYSQCLKGFGYPVVLSEAHEQAVITGADRERFWNMVERALDNGGQGVQRSLKQRSKRTRWI